MTCEIVRERLDEGIRDPEVEAHLPTCAACHAEAEFRGRLSAAVASMARQPAPEGFAARVMAEVQPHTDVAHQPVRPRDLALGPWEIGGIAALCLLLVSLLPLLWRWWPVPRAGAFGRASFGGWVDGVGTALAAWRMRASTVDGADLAAIWSGAVDYLTGWSGTSLLWLCGVASFALAFYILLSWRPGGGVEAAMEDAHA